MWIFVATLVGFGLGFFARDVLCRGEISSLREQNKRYRAMLHNKVKLMAAIARLKRNSDQKLSGDLLDLKK
jgi:hypothetical protein